MRRLVLLSFAVAALGVQHVRGAEHHVQLDCWAPQQLTFGPYSVNALNHDRSTGITWAPQAIDHATSSGSGTPTQSLGFEFPDDATTEIQCSIILPSNYDSSGAVPQVTLSGWAIDDDVCDAGPPPVDDYVLTVKFAVASRAYSAGDVLTEAWSSPQSDDFEFGCPISISLDDMRKSLTLDAAASASAWAANDLVFIRVQRTGTVLGDDYFEPFHLASVTLRMDLQ